MTASHTIPAPPFAGPHGETMSPSRVVQTTHAPVQGLDVDGISTYRGIRYAAPPVGELRFRPPTDPERTTRVQECLGFGPPAMQGIDGAWLSPDSDFALSRMTYASSASDVKLQNEDCLYLNVWTPGADDARRPVLVWLHGGGFAYGAGSDAFFDGENLARRGDIVVVTLNHRLNLFGFMALDGVDDHYADSSNVGMQDVVHALRWVHDNIASFGGDPANVTVGGQSGGGGKVSHLMGMPSAKGLYQRAIVQSGAALRGMEHGDMVDHTRAILRAAGMGDTFDRNWLESVPATHLLHAAIGSFRSQDPEHEARFKTVKGMTGDLAARLRTAVDGNVLPAHPFDPEASSVAADVPLLIGWVKDEWTFMLAGVDPDFVRSTAEDVEAGVAPMYDGRGRELLELAKGLYPHYSPGHLASLVSGAEISLHTTLLADRKSAQPADVFAYELAWETPVGDGIFRTPHCLDLPLVFDNVEKARAFVGPGDEPQRMADQMSDAWVAFIRSGSPGTPALPSWPAYEREARNTMVFDLDSRVVSDPHGALHEVLRNAE
ncbi:carboxylic ester hydrolase [Pseudoclavibacter endophyticus]|uniref:Carboxylic ester hydrolase n=1 Tax=Pseudoclavibacter endophyticus TaxID=1778590 RepID=A0A6H9WR07_9MICO|nr:carboxylesterase family protein [Pseudoclavibacter endophyticus]KAB1648760.1 carboxylesterase/lipase family protein [Pseudoclavibacter endophyticus]GGA68736.1 carboxylic ester hydrolase [Pseudoclavibacter endophyticus]